MPFFDFGNQESIFVLDLSKKGRVRWWIFCRRKRALLLRHQGRNERAWSILCSCRARRFGRASGLSCLVVLDDYRDS